MTNFSPYLDWIHTQHDVLLSRLKHWVEINTYSLNVQGLQKLAEVLRSSFEILGSSMTSHSLSPINRIDQEGSSQSLPLGPVLVMRKRPHARKMILLGGHFDTVYPPDHPFQNIDETHSNRWKGPGIADMKGGIAILLTALEALERSPFAENIGWEVILNPDEEIGSPGSAFLFKEAAQRNDCGILFEPSFPDGAFVHQRKGSATFTVNVYGKAAHVGRDFDQGRSAVFALAHYIHRLDALKNQGDLTINVAELEGKGPVNIIPPFARCRLNLRASNPSDLIETSKKLQILAHECESDGIRIQIYLETFRNPKPFDPNTIPLYEAFSLCAGELNLPFHLRETGGVCDGNILAEAGLPTFDTAGAIGGGLHTPDEYLICSSLVERAKLTTLFLFKLATGQIEIKKENKK